MNYYSGTYLAKWQWDQMFSTALINNPFESDEEAMAMAECNAAKPKQKGVKEGQLETTRGKMYIQAGSRSVQTDCSQNWFYHTGFTMKGEPKPADWYKDESYYQIVAPAIKGLIILTDDSYLDYNERELFEIQNLKLGYIFCYQILLSQDSYDASVFEKALTDAYASRAYQELTAEISKIHYMRSGRAESISPEFELLSLGLGTVVKKISVTFASKVSLKALTPKAFYLAAREALGKTKVGKVLSVDELKVFLDKVTDATTVAQLEENGIKVFFRGTTRSKVNNSLFPGNPNSIANGISMSTDPVRSTIFAIESATNNGSYKGVLQIAVPKELRTTKLSAPNRRVDIELEVVFNTSAENFSKLSKVEISVDDARKLVKEVYGIELPSIIDRAKSTELLETLPISSLEKAQEFYYKTINIK